MSEAKPEPQDAYSEESGESESFAHLALHPTVKGWKRKLYGLLSGERSSTLSKLGIEQYVRVLLAESKDKSAEYCFSEALSEVIQNWNPLLLESADRLNKRLSLIAAFTPAVGFSKVLTHLEKSEDFKRSEERVSDEYEPVDLYHKGLVALAQYYLTPPFHSYDDLGFAAYRALLERNLEDERYNGYAAVRLLELKVLDVKSPQFASLFLKSDHAAAAVFETLLDQADEPQQLQSVGRRLGDLLVTCAAAGDIERFRYIAELNNAEFNPEGDYQVFLPTLTLADGRVVEIIVDLEVVKKTALNDYVKYDIAKVRELLEQETLDGDKINRYISGYVTEVMGQTDARDELKKELSALKAQIHTSGNSFVLTVARPDVRLEIKLELAPSQDLMRWILNIQPVTRFKFARAA